jgi:dipeptidyl aminopeptidase/acylaminoacyl peptidase
MDTRRKAASAACRAPRLADLSWSPDQRYLAFRTSPGSRAKESGVELWLLDMRQKAARKLAARPLDRVCRGFSGCRTARPAGALAPAGWASRRWRAASGRAVEQDSVPGGVRQLRTYQDLLKNEAGRALFEHYITVQLALLDVHGKQRLVGQPGQFSRASASPDGKYLLTTASCGRIPTSCRRTTSATDRSARPDGKVVHTVADLPLEEGLPPGNDAVSAGVRSVSWRADAPATLVWAEAQDGGDPARAAEIRDMVYMQAAPFTDRRPCWRASRYAGVAWGRGDLALLNEAWHKTRAKQWMIAPDQPSTPADLCTPARSRTATTIPAARHARGRAGLPRLLIAADGPSCSTAGRAGRRPSVHRPPDLPRSRRSACSRAPRYYENVVAVLDEDGSRLLSTRESPTEQPNYYLRDLPAGRRAADRADAFPHPTAAAEGRAERADPLQARRRRGPDGDPDAAAELRRKRDGPLPTLMWAYPQEFKTASAASQTTGSPYKFNAVSYWGPAAFLSMGYAVLDNPSFPIVGNGEQEPNDTYLPQLVADAEAAVDEVVRAAWPTATASPSAATRMAPS